MKKKRQILRYVVSIFLAILLLMPSFNSADALSWRDLKKNGLSYGL